MTDDSTVAACRAALLKACGELIGLGKPYIGLDDAAACMARAIEMAAQRNGRTNQDHVRAALAAAQRT